MRFFSAAFRCFFTQRIRSAKFWLILLMLPLITVTIHHLTVSEPTTPVTVGVVLPADSSSGIWELLEIQNSDLLTFVQTDPVTLDQQVTSGKWDCGLIFPDDFDERIRQQETERLVVLRIGPGSAVYPLVQESVSAALAQLAAPIIAWDYLVQNQISAASDFSQMQDILTQMESSTKRIGIQLTTADGSSLAVPQILETSSRQILFWLIAAVILTRVLFASADLCRFSASDSIRRMHPLRSAFSLTAAKACVDSLLICIPGCLAIVLIGGGIWGCLAVMSYTLLWMFLSILLSQFPGAHSPLAALVPFAPVISFLLSSAAVDISLLLPNLAPLLSWIPVSLYLQTCNGNPMALIVLIAASFTLFCAGFLLDRLLQRSSGAFR